MAAYTADISWTLRKNEDFAPGRYCRAHQVSFDGGVTLAASASPHVVGKWADPAAVDPEEMLVAALSSCHMLTFLHIARLAGYIARSYRDHAEGLMAEIAPDRLAVTKVVPSPVIEWTNAAPDAGKLETMHREAHAGCYIANSVRTEVVVRGV